jgi:signal transduction histidine kinase
MDRVESGHADSPEELERLKLIEAAVRAAGWAMVVIDRRGRFAFANPAAERLFAEGVLTTPYGQPLARSGDLPFTLALETWAQQALVVCREGEQGRQEYIGDAAPIRDEAGTVLGAVAAFVEASPLDLAQVFDQAPIGIAILRGPHQVYEYVNPAYQAFVPAAELIGLPFANACWDTPGLLDRVKKTWNEGTMLNEIDVPVSIVRTPGQPAEPRWFTFTCVKVHRRTPPDALLAMVLDTTARVQTERRNQALLAVAQARAAELQSVFDTMLEGVVLFNRERRIVQINQAARDLLVQLDATPELLERPAELIEKLDGHAMGRKLREEELPVNRALTGHRSRITICYPDTAERKEIHVTLGATPLRDPHGMIVGALAVVSDITEALELDRLKDQFIRVIAHELKTPVTIVKGYARAIADSLGRELSPAVARMVDAMNRGADRIDRMVTELVDAQQLAVGRLHIVEERIDLQDLVQEAVDLAARKTSIHRVRLVHADRVVLTGDRERLREVMRILLDNAVRYSPAGGDVRVDLTVSDGGALVSVHDHGVGIARARQPRIFERFYRAHTDTPYDFGGTGLGLYVAKTLVELHQGAMWFESTEGRGSTFSFRLPQRRTP